MQDRKAKEPKALRVICFNTDKVKITFVLRINQNYLVFSFPLVFHSMRFAVLCAGEKICGLARFSACLITARIVCISYSVFYYRIYCYPG